MSETLEFIGGPVDGRVQEWRDAPLLYFVPVSPSVAELWSDEPHPTELGFVKLTYERDVISDDTHHWRYVFKR